MEQSAPAYIAFDGNQRIALGTLSKVALTVKETAEAHPLARILVFNASTSELIDFDYRGTPAQMLRRLKAATKDGGTPSTATPPERPRTDGPVGPGRPRLGVVAREVTLLPRHWEWLSSQPGGASVALRKLVEHAKRSSAPQDAIRQSQASAYRFMSAMAGSLDGFEEAARALFAAERGSFDTLIAPWPGDVRAHLQQLAGPAFLPAPHQDTQHA